MVHQNGDAMINDCGAWTQDFGNVIVSAHFEDYNPFTWNDVRIIHKSEDTYIDLNGKSVMNVRSVSFTDGFISFRPAKALVSFKDLIISPIVQ